MSKFEPTTTIEFCRTGIDATNKPYFEPSFENKIAAWIKENHCVVATAKSYSFQRTDGRMRVAVASDDCDYDTLMNCDTIMYQNADDGFYIIGNITSVQWINPNNTYVFYEVDYYCTYAHLISWDGSMCYVEREHVKEDWVNNGGECPQFSNMGPEEQFALEPDTPLYYGVMNFIGFGLQSKYVIYSPYGESGEKADFKSKVEGGVLTGLQQIVFESEGEVDAYLNAVAESDEADVDRIPLIQTIPHICGENRVNHQTIEIPLPWLYNEKEITGRTEDYNITYKKNVNTIRYRNAKCWSSQFCKLRLSSHEGDTIDYNPQWFGSGRASTQWHVWAQMSAGNIGIVSGLQPSNIDMTIGGMNDFLVRISNAGESPWVGNAYAQWKQINKYAVGGRIMQGVNSALGGIIGSAQTNDIIGMARFGDTVGSFTNRMMQIATSIRQAKASGASVNGGFSQSANEAAALQTYGFQLVAYIVQPYIMDAVDEFFDIFGYNVSRVKVPERNTRKYWNFVKTHDAHIAGKKLSYVARTAIEDLLNGGVTFWNGENVTPDGGGGVSIGDYTKTAREQNRAVGG